MFKAIVDEAFNSEFMETSLSLDFDSSTNPECATKSHPFTVQLPKTDRQHFDSLTAECLLANVQHEISAQETYKCDSFDGDSGDEEFLRSVVMEIEPMNNNDGMTKGSLSNRLTNDVCFNNLHGKSIQMKIASMCHDTGNETTSVAQFSSRKRYGNAHTFEEEVSKRPHLQNSPYSSSGGNYRTNGIIMTSCTESVSIHCKDEQLPFVIDKEVVKQKANQQIKNSPGSIHTKNSLSNHSIIGTLQGPVSPDYHTSTTKSSSNTSTTEQPFSCSQNLETRFTDELWISMKKAHCDVVKLMDEYPIRKIMIQASRKLLPLGKVPATCVMIEELANTGMDMRVVVRDPSGSMKATIHRLLVKEHCDELKPGTVLVLKQCAVFSPTARDHYLNITPNNLVDIYSYSSQRSVVHKRLLAFTPSDLTVPEPNLVLPMNSPRTPQQRTSVMPDSTASGLFQHVNRPTYQSVQRSTLQPKRLICNASYSTPMNTVASATPQRTINSALCATQNWPVNSGQGATKMQHSFDSARCATSINSIPWATPPHPMNTFKCVTPATVTHSQIKEQTKSSTVNNSAFISTKQVDCQSLPIKMTTVSTTGALFPNNKSANLLNESFQHSMHAQVLSDQVMTVSNSSMTESRHIVSVANNSHRSKFTFKPPVKQVTEQATSAFSVADDDLEKLLADIPEDMFIS